LRLPYLICNLDPIKDAGRLISGACRRSTLLIKYFPGLILDRFHDETLSAAREIAIPCQSSLT